MTKNQTTLTLRLIDGVSRPGRAVEAAIGGINRAMSGIRGAAFAPFDAGGRAAQRFAADMTRAQGASAGVGVGAALAARQVYSLERELNVSQAAGNLDLGQRNQLLAEAVELNATYAATTAEIVAAANELLKSGFDFDQALGALPGVLDVAQAMGEPIGEASAAVVNTLTAYRMSVDGTEETMRSAIRVADQYALAVNETTGSLEDFRTSNRYFAPVAAAVGMTPEEAFGFQTALAKNSIFGSSAGTGLRSMPISIAAPSPKARAAWAAAGLDPATFVRGRAGDASADTIAAILGSQGLSAEGLENAIDQILRAPGMREAPARAAIAIIDTIGDELGIATAEDRSTIADLIQRHIRDGVAAVDAEGAIRALHESGAGIDIWAAIFGKQHFGKMLSLDPDILRSAIEMAENESAGTARRMRQAMMGGVVGDWNALTAAVEKFSIAIGSAGLLGDAERSITRLAGSIDRLGDSNPGLLRFGAYAALAVAAAAPLGLAISGIAAVAGLAISPITIAAGGLAALAIVNLKPIAEGFRSFSYGLRKAIDPAVMARIRELFARGSGIFSRLDLTLGSGALRRFGQDLGTGLGGLVNRLADAGPRVRSAVTAISNAFSGDLLDRLTDGGRSLAELAIAFAQPKIDGALRLGEALAEFGAKVVAGLGPSVPAAIDLVAGSFNTLVAGGRLVSTVLGSAITGFTAFSSSFLEAISPGAVASIGEGLASLFEAIQVPLRGMRRLFSSVSGFLDGTNSGLASFASNAGSAVGAGISAIVGAFANLRFQTTTAWESVKALFATIGSYVPSFGGIIGGIRAFVDTVVSLAQTLSDAVESMLNAVARLPGAGAGMPGLGTGSQANPGDAASRIGAMGGQAIMGNPPGRASGGAVRRGPYLVGERGPELVHMGRNGYVTPNHRMPAPANGPITINIYGATDPKRTGLEVERRLDRFASRSQQTSMNS